MKRVIRALGAFASIAVGLPLASTCIADESFSPLPTDVRDVEDRAIVRVGIGFDPVFASLSGNPDLLDRLTTGDALRTRSLLLDTDFALGTRGLLLPIVNVYALGAAMIDLDGAPAVSAPIDGISEPRPSIHPGVFDRYDRGQAILFHLAYAEIEGLATSGVLSAFHVRAGRQFHFGPASLTFDGVTLGYDDERLRVAVRVGQRSATYDRSQGDRGLVAGADVAFRAIDRSDLKLGFRAELLHFSRELALLQRDRDLAAGSATIDTSATVTELGVEFDAPADNVIASARLSLVGGSVSHVRADLDWALSPVTIRVELDQKIGRDLFYDLGAGVGPRSQPRALTYESLRLNVPDRRPYSDVVLIGVLDAADWLLIELEGGARKVYASADSRTVYDADQIRFSGAMRGRFAASMTSAVEADLVYYGVRYFREGSADGIFDDAASGGEQMLHEVAAEVRFVRGERFVGRRLLAGRSLSMGLSGFLRVVELDNRYVDAVHETTFGPRADVSLRVTRFAKVQLGYELVFDSSVFLPHLGAFHGITTRIEGRF